MDIRIGAGQTWGKYANNIHTLNITQELVGYKKHDDIKFTATIPQNGFPHKNRCLVMIDSFSFRMNKPNGGGVQAPHGGTVTNFAASYINIMAERTIAVSLDGLGVMNSYDTVNRQNDVVGVVGLLINKGGALASERFVRSIDKGGDILSRGVLAQSPFGKSLGIRILDATTLKPLTHSRLATDYDIGAIDPANGNLQVARGGGLKVDVSLVLKILFLDEEDMKSV